MWLETHLTVISSDFHLIIVTAGMAVNSSRTLSSAIFLMEGVSWVCSQLWKSQENTCFCEPGNWSLYGQSGFSPPVEARIIAASELPGKHMDLFFPFLIANNIFDQVIEFSERNRCRLFSLRSHQMYCFLLQSGKQQVWQQPQNTPPLTSSLSWMKQCSPKSVSQSSGKWRKTCFFEPGYWGLMAKETLPHCESWGSCSLKSAIENIIVHCFFLLQKTALV